jgi:RNA-directed DNA polymerase
MRQKNQVELNLGTGATGEARSAAAQETEARAARPDTESPAAGGPSMEAIIERNNLRKALAQVKRNKGAAGIDGMTFEDLTPYLKEHWPTIRAQLSRSRYGVSRYRRRRVANLRSAFDGA